MRLLSLDNNRAFPMETIPNEVDDLRFCVLDNSDVNNPDYFYIPLIFLESFSSPALVLNIGGHTVKMPLDWQILIGEPEFGDLEVVPLTSVNDRGFKAFALNPISSFRPDFLEICVVDIYQDVQWYFPKLRPGQMLAVPLDVNIEKPLCVFFVKDISKACEVVQYSEAW